MKNILILSAKINEQNLIFIERYNLFHYTNIYLSSQHKNTIYCVVLMRWGLIIPVGHKEINGQSSNQCSKNQTSNRRQHLIDVVKNGNRISKI